MPPDPGFGRCTYIAHSVAYPRRVPTLSASSPRRSDRARAYTFIVNSGVE